MSFDLWHSADPDAQGEGGTLDPPADGTYIVTLTEGSAFTAKESGNAFVKTAFRDEASAYDWTVLHGFKSQAQANVTKKSCRTLGVDIDNVTSQEQLSEAVAALVGQYFQVTVKTNGQFRNTYIDGPATGGLSQPPVVSMPEDDDGVPF